MINMKKTATTVHPIHELIAERWSPYGFNGRPVQPETLGSLFEAARWAASSFNEQPWSFLVASANGDRVGFDRLAACLVPGNAEWATKAPVLALSVASQNFTRNGKPNRHAAHDVGLAVGNLILQAQALGLSVHQMAGFDADKARTDLAIPEGHEPLAMLAIGYAGFAEGFSEQLAERESAPRQRRELASMVFGARWEEAYRGFA